MPDEQTQTLEPELAELTDEAFAAAENGATADEQQQPEGEQPAAQEPEAEKAWWAKYGATEEEAAAQIANIDTLRGRQANELGEYRQRLEALEQQVSQPPSAAPEQQIVEEINTLFSPQELARYQAWAEDDPDAAGAAFEDALGMRRELAALRADTQQMRHDVVAQRQIERATAEFGDQWTKDVREAVAEVVANDPTYFDVPEDLQYRRLRDTAELALRRAGTFKGQPSSQPSPGAPAGERNVHVEGGSGPQPSAPPQVDPVVAEMDEVDRDRDIFGARSRL